MLSIRVSAHRFQATRAQQLLPVLIPILKTVPELGFTHFNFDTAGRFIYVIVAEARPSSFRLRKYESR